MSPAYNDSPFVQRASIVVGNTAYSLGSFNDRVPDSRMQITSVAITSDVATCGVILREGLVPVVGQLVTILGTQTATSGGAPNFNVQEAPITGVSGFNTGDESVGTISFALSSDDIATTKDAGNALAPPPEVPEPMVVGAGQAFAVPRPGSTDVSGRPITYEIITPSAPDSFSVNLEGSLTDEDDQYFVMDTAAAAGSHASGGYQYNFVRINVTDVTGGTDPSIIAKILI